MFNTYKKKRIVNININIILAAIISTLLAAYPVYLTKFFTNNLFQIVLFSIGADAILDISLFAFFHWIVHKNHSKKVIAMDFALIQSHRIILSILYYIIAGSFQFILMNLGFYRTGSFITAYFIALIITRTIHTWYGLKTGLFKDLKTK
jgi:hypothetical protein